MGPDKSFYLQNALALAPQLLGMLLVHETPEGTASGIIVEVEAYMGRVDMASHSYQCKRTPRTEVQFGPGGHAYIYALYGLHSCLNVVANAEGEPEAVLIRALEPVCGVPLMQQRRGTACTRQLCNGPGKLCQALGITKAQYGLDMASSPLRIEHGPAAQKMRIMASPRINIDYAGEHAALPWRFYAEGNPCVSPVAKRYREAIRPYVAT